MKNNPKIFILLLAVASFLAISFSSSTFAAFEGELLQESQNCLNTRQFCGDEFWGQFDLSDQNTLDNLYDVCNKDRLGQPRCFARLAIQMDDIDVCKSAHVIYESTLQAIIDICEESFNDPLRFLYKTDIRICNKVATEECVMSVLEKLSGGLHAQDLEICNQLLVEELRQYCMANVQALNKEIKLRHDERVQAGKEAKELKRVDSQKRSRYALLIIGLLFILILLNIWKHFLKLRFLLGIIGLTIPFILWVKRDAVLLSFLFTPLISLSESVGSTSNLVPSILMSGLIYYLLGLIIEKIAQNKWYGLLLLAYILFLMYISLYKLVIIFALGSL